jgi:hypothetical protein
MKLERPRPAVVRVTLSAWELAALIAAARWAVEDGQGEVTVAAREQLERVLANYDRAIEVRARG